jgi:hypothetical protein
MADFDYSSLKSVGTDVVISPNAEIRRPQLVRIGSHVAVDAAYIATAAEIADYAHIGPYVTVIGGPKARLSMGKPVYDLWAHVDAPSAIRCVNARATRGHIDPAPFFIK